MAAFRLRAHPKLRGKSPLRFGLRARTLAPHLPQGHLRSAHAPLAVDITVGT